MGCPSAQAWVQFLRSQYREDQDGRLGPGTITNRTSSVWGQFGQNIVAFMEPLLKKKKKMLKDTAIYVRC